MKYRVVYSFCCKQFPPYRSLRAQYLYSYVVLFSFLLVTQSGQGFRLTQNKGFGRQLQATPQSGRGKSLLQGHLLSEHKQHMSVCQYNVYKEGICKIENSKRFVRRETLALSDVIFPSLQELRLAQVARLSYTYWWSTVLDRSCFAYTPCISDLLRKVKTRWERLRNSLPIPPQISPAYIQRVRSGLGRGQSVQPNVPEFDFHSRTAVHCVLDLWNLKLNPRDF